MRYIVLLIIFSHDVCAQSTGTYSIENLKYDFRVFRGALEEAHAGIYWYRSKAEIDAAFNTALVQIDHPMAELEFYRILAPVISSISCGHTWIATTDATQKKIWDNGKVLPLRIKFLEGRMYCIENNSSDSTTIIPRDEILSINDYTVDALLKLCDRFNPGDGQISTGRLRILDNVFNQFFTLYIDNPTTYTLRTKRGIETRTTNLPATTLTEFNHISQRRYPKQEQPVTGNIQLSFGYNSVALLRIKEFSDWTEGKRRIEFPLELKKVFQRIDSSKTTNLILDLRDNDGGNEKYALLLYSYFTNKPFRGYKQIDFRTTDFSFRKFSTTRWLAYKTIKSKLKTEKVNDSTYLLTNDLSTSMQQSAKNPFRGHLYVLINRGSFSSTSDLTALLHFNQLATFIGEETGGSYVGNTSNYSFTIILPKTKIKLSIPVARYQVNVEPGEHFGRGTSPDYPVIYSIEDVLRGVDREMAVALSLVGR